MILKYYVLDPTGNITILAEGNVPEEERGAVAAKLMEKEPAAEQVGFISYGQARVDRTDAGHAAGEENRGAGHADITLQMAGGEFCGNATMSAAVLAVHLGKVRDESAANREEKGTCANREEKGICADGENSYNVNVLASGAEGIRRVHIEAKEDGSYMGTVDMPEPISIVNKKLPFEGREYELPVVDFGGITHVICDAEKFPIFQPGKAGKAVMEWCDFLSAECLGLMIFDREEGRLDPLVYVPKAGTLVWESSCASGTTAVGAYLARQAGTPVRCDISEPGGTLTISATPEGRLSLTGCVKILLLHDFIW